MRLSDALTMLADQLGLNAPELIGYAAEDNIGGRDTGTFPPMSTFADEGRVLYALIRALKPKQCAEVGVDSGGTSTHILSALLANDVGKLWSVDIKDEVGQGVPDGLRPLWTLVTGQDALTVKLPKRADFIFEDGEHGYDFTFNMLLRLKELKPRMIISHDYFTHLTYGDSFAVERAFQEALPEGYGIMLDGAFTGLGIWVNPNG